MKSKIFVALSSLALSVGVHLYLTLHYYPLHLGFASGQSICNLNAKFDCDAVSASSFSDFLGIPMALWGASTNAIIFLMVLFSWLGLSANPGALLRYSFWLATMSVGASVVMSLISLTQLENYCLFCIAAYVLSAIAFESLRRVQSESPWSFFSKDLIGLGTQNRLIAVFILAIPALSGLGHYSLMESYGADKLESVIRSTVSDWQASPTVTLDSPPSLSQGAAEGKAKMVIAEFADFRCGHCRAAAPSLASFVKSHSDRVRLLFYSFPLDGSCNSAITSSDGISCRLAKAVYCAENQTHGWEMHETLFQRQEEFHQASTLAETDGIVKIISESIGVNWSNLLACMDEPKTHDYIKSQADLGARIQIRGTPTIFVNGKKLERGQVVPVLSEVLESLK